MTQTVLLGDIATIHDKKRIPLNSRQRAERQGDIPYYGATGILDYVDKPLFDGEYVLVGENGVNLRPKKSDLAFKVVGKFWVNNHAHILQGNEPWINDYVINVFRVLDIAPYITGAAQPKLNQAALMRIPIYWPGEDSAKKIADILGTIDKKIELNRQMNETLEQMGQALFRYYFIDNPEAKKWKEVKIGELVTTKGGGTPSTKNSEFWDGDIAWTSPRDLTGKNDAYILHTDKTITNQGLSKISSGLLPVGTLLLSSRAPIGYIAVTGLPLAINQGYIAFLPDAYLSNSFMYFWVKQNMDRIKNAANGSTFMEISKSAFRNILTTKPSEDSLQKFEDEVSNLFEAMRNNQEQTQILTNLRDILLPRLISGKVKVV